MRKCHANANASSDADMMLVLRSTGSGQKQLCSLISGGGYKMGLYNIIKVLRGKRYTFRADKPILDLFTSWTTKESNGFF